MSSFSHQTTKAWADRDAAQHRICEFGHSQFATGLWQSRKLDTIKTFSSKYIVESQADYEGNHSILIYTIFYFLKFPYPVQVIAIKGLIKDAEGLKPNEKQR